MLRLLGNRDGWWKWESSLWARPSHLSSVIVVNGGWSGPHFHRPGPLSDVWPQQDKKPHQRFPPPLLFIWTGRSFINPSAPQKSAASKHLFVSERSGQPYNFISGSDVQLVLKWQRERPPRCLSAVCQRRRPIPTPSLFWKPDKEIYPRPGPLSSCQCCARSQRDLTQPLAVINQEN